MCVYCPLECEGGIPPRPRSSRLRRPGRLHAQLSGELRDSDGSELICSWCYISFIFVSVMSISVFIHLHALFQSFCLLLPIGRSVCVLLSLSLLSPRHGSRLL